ncbi:TPA: CHAP domain-containing protein, partial [Staphylococcus aureus]
QGYYGHVAYVEGVNSNGSVRVSEMNYGHGAGVVTSRTISANQAGSYNFIH